MFESPIDDLVLLTSGQGIKTFRQLGVHSHETIREIINPKLEGYKFVSTVSMDSKRFVPTSRLVQLVELEKEDGRSSMHSKESFKWSEINGTMVPTFVRKEDHRVQRIGKKKYLLKRTTDAEIHWFSINEEIPDTMFAHSQIQDFNELIKLTDPKATGAVALIGD